MRPITREQIEENLREIISRRDRLRIDIVPDGWITVRDASKILGLSIARTGVYLSESDAERKLFRVSCGKRKCLPVPHFFLGKKLK